MDTTEFQNRSFVVLKSLEEEYDVYIERSKKFTDYYAISNRKLNPDIILRDSCSGKVIAIFDSKNKTFCETIEYIPGKKTHIPVADLYQMFVYLSYFMPNRRGLGIFITPGAGLTFLLDNKIDNITQKQHYYLLSLGNSSEEEEKFLDMVVDIVGLKK